MGIQVVWENDEHTVLRYVIEDPWSWDDLGNAFRQMHAMMDTVDHKVHSIMDMRKTRNIPTNAFTQIKRAGVNDPGHPNHSRLTVFVGASLFAKALLSVIGRTYRTLNEYNDFRFVETVEQAHALLQKERAK